MNVLYNIPHLSQQGGGSRQYAVALLKILARIESIKLFVLHQKQDPEILSTIDGHEHITLIPIEVGREKSFEKKLTSLFRAKSLFSVLSGDKLPYVFTYYNRLCRKYKIELIYSPSPSLMASFASNVIRIGTQHDLQELHLPENFTPEGRLRRARVYLEFLRRTDHIICSYKHVKSDLKKYFNLSDEKITVLLLEMQNLWFVNYDENNLVKLPKELDEKDFVFYPANTWPHKNHIKLISAFKIVLKECPNLQLVCTGHKKEYYQESILPVIEKSKLVNQVHFVGLVEEDLLYTLYQKCKAVVVPTQYEAGSFPLMESMIMGIPVVCSRATSLPETIVEDQFTFEANDINQMAEKIINIVKDKEFIAKNISNSEKQRIHLFETKSEEKLKNLLGSYIKK